MNHPIFEEYKAKSEEFQRVKQELKALNDQILELRRNCVHDLERVAQDTHPGSTQRFTLVCKICGSMVK